jgi:hypothetical protein
VSQAAKTPFVANLRARDETVRMAPQGASAITVRAQLSEAWDTIRIEVAPTDLVENVKLRALEVLDPSAENPDAYVVTHRGFEILNEGDSLASAGVSNGATLLIAHRRRRPVR